MPKINRTMRPTRRLLFQKHSLLVMTLHAHDNLELA